ncbi:hypothetical protein Hanom_Chr16g01467951 [Helianthus anomalus]
MEHLKIRRLPLHYNEEDHPLAVQYIKVVQLCVQSQVWIIQSISEEKISIFALKILH